MSGAWPRSERIDPRWLARMVQAELGLSVRLLGPASGGQVGACFVEWPSGVHSVLSWWPAPSHERWPTVVRVVECLRRAGYPAPRLERLVPVVRGAVVIQERVAGRRIVDVTADILGQLVSLNELQRGRFDDAEGGTADLYLAADGPGFCLHDPLRSYSRRTRDLLSWIEGVGTALGDDVFTGRDAVHFDMHPDNVLLSQETDQIVGVVDWTGARVGDCAFDLVTLAFACERKNVGATLLSTLERRIVETTSAEQRQAYYAHMSLRMVDWAIRHFDAEEIESWISIAERWRARAETAS